MSRLRDERGMTLIELLVAATVSLIVLGATLGVVESMFRQRAHVEAQTEAETAVRQTQDRLARQLRNLASPGDLVTDVAASTQPKSVDRDLPTDLIFKDVGDTRPAGSLNAPNVRRVRYCLQSSGAVPGTTFSASATRQVLWMQFQTWTTAAAPAMPADTACPGSGWTSQRIVADHLVNTSASPLFVYSGDTGVVTGTADADRALISRIVSRIRIDADPTTFPAAAGLTTGVMLRNQNRAPTASLRWTLINPVTCLVELNGAASADPESKPLQYAWYIDGVKQVETGVVVQKVVSKGTHSYSLTVSDPAGLVGTTPTETHTCS
jgi:prepilin-type N-terminal cleavage/methylation domain-containing protein